MAFTIHSPPDEPVEIAAINTTPLVDVMLVLLIIFLITIPVVTQSVPLTLPQAVNQPHEPKIDHITLSVTANGQVYWGVQRLSGTQELTERLRALPIARRPIKLVIGADAATPYTHIDRVLQACSDAQVEHIAFTLEPTTPK